MDCPHLSPTLRVLTQHPCAGTWALSLAPCALLLLTLLSEAPPSRSLSSPTRCQGLKPGLAASSQSRSGPNMPHGVLKVSEAAKRS